LRGDRQRLALTQGLEQQRASECLPKRGRMTSWPVSADPLATYNIEMAPPLEIVAEPESADIRVRLYGEVDLATVGSIGHKIDECAAAGCRRIVVDLRGVTFLDCAGVRVVLAADAAARAGGWELVLVEGTAAVQRVFELAGARDCLPFVPARDDPGAGARPCVALPSANTRRQGRA
jgi:anti-sigma B factor antagonist